MCIAIAKPADKNISDDVLKQCYAKNKDGCGFAYLRDIDTDRKCIKIEKTMNFDTFLKRFRRAEKYNPTSPFLIHFRIGTAGIKNKYNCHPFKINDESCFIHNGVIHNVGVDTLKSDTQLFNDKYLKNLPKGWYKSSMYRTLIESFIGFGNKLCILTTAGEFYFCNEKAGVWDNGIWYSNTGYKVYNTSNYAQNFCTKDYFHSFQRSNITQLYSCEFCNTVGVKKEITPFEYDGGVITLCHKCKRDLLKTSQIFDSDRVSWKYYEITKKAEEKMEDRAQYFNDFDNYYN